MRNDAAARYHHTHGIRFRHLPTETSMTVRCGGPAKRGATALDDTTAFAKATADESLGNHAKLAVKVAAHCHVRDGRNHVRRAVTYCATLFRLQPADLRWYVRLSRFRPVSKSMIKHNVFRRVRSS